jgi:predicted site-specific integrase-resolvase
MDTKQKKLASVRYFAKMSKVTVKTVYEYINSGLIKAEIKEIGGRKVKYIDITKNKPIEDRRKNYKVPDLL